ncbi:nucleolar and coiled-body phosphoprotein 1-like [Schistocerca americana]|uniref:nucleolar and coiled-body phosphoprotein 1-like n=1 Tax=Schistocerca americana TaxID=7009 RepID=UPI001F4FADC0|nr:nucleolar and coiled-body phosphoprotein 1-like [Schistocerca americana]
MRNEWPRKRPLQLPREDTYAGRAQNLAAEFPPIRDADAPQQRQPQENAGSGSPAGAETTAAAAQPAPPGEGEPVPVPATGQPAGNADKRQISDASSDEAEQQGQPICERAPQQQVQEELREEQATENTQIDATTPAGGSAAPTVEQTREQWIKDKSNHLRKVLKLNQNDDVTAKSSTRGSSDKPKRQQNTDDEQTQKTKMVNKPAKKSKKRRSSNSSQDRRENSQRDVRMDTDYSTD